MSSDDAHTPTIDVTDPLALPEIPDVDDLSDDVNGLVSAIATFSFDFTGFKKKMEDLLQQQLAIGPGLGGEAVQPTANGAAPTGDGS